MDDNQSYLTSKVDVQSLLNISQLQPTYKNNYICRTNTLTELRPFKLQVDNSCHEKKLHTFSVFCYNACVEKVNFAG